MEEAQEQINLNIETDIQGYDIDAAVVHSARENARRAGVEELIHFQQRPVSELHHPKKYGFIITNPPYGERLEEKQNFRHFTGRSERALTVLIPGPNI